jgi:L-alanine-DL-glutamate epimerase-like enolase superfamily enzyme
MKDLRVKGFSVETVRAPLKRPFVTALGRKDETVNVSIRITLEGGACGYGEASTSLAMAHLRPKAMALALEDLGRSSIGQQAAPRSSLIAEAWKIYSAIPPAAAAFECALLEAALSLSGLSLAEWLGGSLKGLESDLTISACGPEATAMAASEAASEGFSILKIKLSGKLKEDLERLRTARQTCPAARLILDGNQSLTRSGALRLIETCLRDNTEVLLLEQPLPKEDFRGMAALSRTCPVPVAADEMAQSPEDCLRIASEEAAKVINIKVAKSGILRSLEMAAVARSAGLDLMIGCMAETAPGLKASVHLALGTGFFRYVDLDSDCLLKPLHRAQPVGWVRRGAFLSLS